MELDLRNLRSSFGYFATVVFLPSGTAVKVFRRHQDSENQGISEETYRSEVHAYKIATKDAQLSLIVPTYYGPKSITKIVDSQGKDISKSYVLAHNYEMATIPGKFIKIGKVGWEKSRPVQEAFKACGIGYTEDSDVLLNEQGEITCVIDFACTAF